MKKILLILLCGVLFVPLGAQQVLTTPGDRPTENRPDYAPRTGGVQAFDDYAPRTGNIQAALLLGKGMFYSGSDYLLYIDRNTAVVGDGLTEDLPYYLTLNDPNNNLLVNMVGVEFRYFVTDRVSVSLSGMGYHNRTPWRETVDPTLDANDEVILPKYETIDAQVYTRVVVNLGAQYYFDVNHPRIHPYAGLMGTFQFAGLSAQSTYAGIDRLAEDEKDAGRRTGQIRGWAPSLTAGIEYSVLPGFVLGFEIRPASVYYSGLELFAQPGLDAMTGENVDWSFFSSPQFKISFRF